MEKQQQTAKILHYGPWQIPYACTNVLCSDGKRRYAKLASEADTFFSIPASVQVKGKTVSGFITSVDDFSDVQDYEFHAYTYRKNGNLLPNK